MSDGEIDEIIHEIDLSNTDYEKLAQAMIQQGFPNFDTTALCKIMGVDSLPDELQEILNDYLEGRKTNPTAGNRSQKHDSKDTSSSSKPEEKKASK